MFLLPFFEVCLFNAFFLLFVRHFGFSSQKSKLLTKIMKKI
jgi:hypothetical protein